MSQRGTFRYLVAGLEGLLEEVNTALDGRFAVHRWGVGDVQPPACWLWLDDGETANDDLGCQVTDKLTWKLIFAVPPRAGGPGDDLLDIEEIVDVAVPIIDRAMRDSIDRLGVRTAARIGLSVGARPLGDASITRLELLVSTAWEHRIPDPIGG